MSTSISWSAPPITVSNGSASIPGDYDSDTYDDIHIDSDGTLTNNGTLVVSNTLSNEGVLENNASLTINNSTTNDGNLLNRGAINSSNFSNTANGILTNSGTFNNSGSLENQGVITVTGTLNTTSNVNNDFFGTLNIGDGGSVGTLNGDIDNGGSLVFNRADNSTYEGTIWMPMTEIGGMIIKRGSGKLTLSGISNATGGTTVVEAGELYLTGGLGSSDVTVQNGATLSGKSGLLPPFDNFGRISTLTLEPGANYIARPHPNPSEDEYIYVNYGTTDLSTANLIIELSPGIYTAGTPHQLFMSAQGNFGEFASSTLSATDPRLQYTLTYDASGAVYATFSYLPIKEVPLGNPGSVAHYIKTNAPDSLKVSLNNLTLPELTKALNDLSPATQTQKAGMVGNNELNQMNAPFTWTGMDRLINRVTHADPQLIRTLHSFKHSFNTLFGSKLQHKTTLFSITQSPDAKHSRGQTRIAYGKANIWFQNTGGRFTQSNIADASGLSVHGLDGTTSDTSMGVDYAFRSDSKLGFLTGYTHSHFKTKVNGDRGSTTSIRGGVYGLWEGEKTYINGAAYYGYHHFKGNRQMTVIPAVAHHKHQGHHISGLAEIGQDIILPQATTVTPYVSGGVLYLTENKYNETGAGNQNLSIHRRHSTTVQGKIGAQLSKVWKWNQTMAYSFGRLGVTYQRTLRKNQKITAHLLGQGGEFSVITKNTHRLLINPSVGITANLTNAFSASVVYEGAYNSLQRTHQALVKFNLLI